MYAACPSLLPAAILGASQIKEFADSAEFCTKIVSLSSIHTKEKCVLYTII